MATALPNGLTAGQFLGWWAGREEDDDKAFELDRGRVVERRSPGTERHGFVCGLVVRLLWQYLEPRGAGYALSNNPGLLVERDPDTVFCPDLLLYLTNPTAPLGDGLVSRTPDLAVEVLDDEDATARMRDRAARLHAAGVPLIWLVSSVDLSVAPCAPGVPYVELKGDDELTGNGVLPDFRCRVADLFALPGQPPAGPQP